MDELQEALERLASSDPGHRESALDTIGTLKPENALEILLEFLLDEDHEVRETAACNLGEISDERSIPYLVNLAENDPEESVRAESLAALENFRKPEILKCLIDEIYRPKRSRRPRQIVAQQLKYYDREESVDALSKLLLEEEDVYVRIFSADSLFVLNRPRLIKLWKKALDDENRYVADVAIKALEKLQNSKSLLEAG